MRKRKYLFLLPLLSTVAFLAILLWIFLNKQKGFTSPLCGTPILTNKTKVLVNNIPVYVDIADTSNEWQKGLSGIECLKENEGMLFIFGHKSLTSFWMKDMLIPIDIIWIADGKIVHIDKNIPPPKKGTPDNQLQIYTPPVAIDYVLEVNAGFSEKNNINLDDTVELLNTNPE